MLIKYRIYELAKDLDVPNKEIIAIVKKYFDVDKKHMTSLTEDELNILFEYFTQNNQVPNLNAYASAPLKPAASKKENQPERDHHHKTQQPENKNTTPKNKEKPKTSVAPQKGKVTVEMRAVNVNLDKYNERYEKMVQSPNNDRFTNKQKLSSKYNKWRGSKKNLERMNAQEKMELERKRRQNLKVLIPEEIVVNDLALKLKVTSSEVIKKLISLGVIANITQTIDYDTAAIVAEELGFNVEKEVVVTIEERLFEAEPDNPEDLMPRSPVVVVMGHVDHGKTSLLDAIKNTAISAGEAGGITQHVAAYRVPVKDSYITFLDTPGHEAFTAMRARGAQVTDIAILVVAADDGIMPQTVEAINHAKAAGVTIIVAINKIDKPEADVEKIKQELTEYDLVPEEWGGETICVPVSAKSHQNIDTLLDMVLLVAELKDLKANPKAKASGAIIEAKLDKGKGPLATLLIQNGTLKVGDMIIAGTAVGKIRTIYNDSGAKIKQAGPSTPVEVTGLSETPSAGDIFNVVEDEKLAKELAEKRKTGQKEEQFKQYQKITLDNLFDHIASGEMKTLNIIIKADVQGSVEALKQSLEKLSGSEVRVKVIHGAVGAVNKSDIMLAEASHAIIIGFNVRSDAIAQEMQSKSEVDVRFYRVIYDAINEIKDAMRGLLTPKTRDVEQGSVLVQMVYKISSVGTVAGCKVSSGKVTRNSKIRVVRDGIIVADDTIASLKRQKDNVKEVLEGFECGILLEKFADIKEGDIFEAYTQESYIDDKI